MNTTLKVISLIGILSLTFYFGLRSNKPEKPNPHIKVVTDTVYISKPYPEIQVIRDTLKPERVMIYQTDSEGLDWMTVWYALLMSLIHLFYKRK